MSEVNFWFLLILDYNECARTGMCTHGKCVNMNGGYMCICNPGFVAAPDGKACIGRYYCKFPKQTKFYFNVIKSSR